MGTFSGWHWLVFGLAMVPNLMFLRAVRRSGFGAWWVLLSLVPVLGLVLLWVWAYAKWPAEPDR